MGNIVGIAIVWLIIEMLVWYLIAQFVSGWWVFLWFVVAGLWVQHSLKEHRHLKTDGWTSPNRHA